MINLILALSVGLHVLSVGLLVGIIADNLTRRYNMRFRVSQTISDERLERDFSRYAKVYCHWVLKEGAMGGNALKAQREMMQHYEEQERRRRKVYEDELAKAQLDQLKLFP